MAVAVTQNSHNSSQPSASRWMRLVGLDFGIGRRFTQRNAAARGRNSHPAPETDHSAYSSQTSDRAFAAAVSNRQ